MTPRSPARAPRPGRADEGTLHRTRWRLALWSGAITLVVLVLLGSGLYLLATRQLAMDSEAQLRARASAMASDPFMTGAATVSLEGWMAVAGSAELPGLLFGGPLSGTFGTVIDLGAPGEATDPPELFTLTDVPGGLLGPMGIASIMPGEIEAEEVTLTEIDGTPVRVLNAPVDTDQRAMVVQVLSDRSAEVATLQSLLLVLLIAIPLAALAAGVAGWAYSGRALIPIRSAIDRQRRFAADASHELRTPLTVLSGNLQALAGATEPISRDDEAISDSLEEAERMSVLLDELLLLARTDAEAVPLDITSMDLADEATDVVEGLATQAEERSIDIVLDAEPGSMQGDAVRLRQLIVILVDNAVRYGHDGGHAWVTVRSGSSTTVLTVADDGPGIAIADRRQVYERFWRGRDVAEPGFGLGLSIAYWIVAAHGGHIDLDERPGGGARFRVSLPNQR